MRLDLVVLAEAATNDTRGALALIGVNQRVVVPTALPFSLKQRVVMMFSDDAGETPGEGFDEVLDGDISIKVFDPSDVQRFAWNQELKLPTEKRWVDLPLIANIIVDVDLSGDSYGVYIVEVSFKSADSREDVRRFPVYVVGPQVATSETEAPRRAFAGAESQQ
jgi:hypothetical protein